ncbi:metallophosphoesterase family protein [Alkalihalobacillus deserti]|uniref:metallophosphoesterase family protein n=1 Tax=Alkalihalobacillus deserti TaxID=2879466 RepID=UPI001D14F91C|nr:metallophosphoesterase [Alkalihalobacillus deserti]
MKIIVISDTHIPKRAKKLPEQLIVNLKQADLIIHAGDWQILEVYQELAGYGEVQGVIGNVDGQDIQERFPEKLIIEVHPFKIGVVHGHGKKLTTERRSLDAFKGEQVDCIVFGHSHIPVIKKTDDILLFNPGSVTDKRRQPCYSYGILTIKEDTIKAEHIFFDDKS